jgi:oligopeptide transport system ATP-binding protein
MEKNLKLHVEDLTVSFKTTQGMVRAVRGVGFDLYEGETLAIVGESGSGKSVSSRTIMGILAGNGVIDKGSIIYEGQDLTEVDEEHFHEIRGNKIGMIFQDPMSSLNPIMRIGKQITEGMILNGKRLKNRTKKLYQLEKNKYTEITHKKEKLERNYKKDLKLIKSGELDKSKADLTSEFKKTISELNSQIKPAKQALDQAKKDAKAQVKKEYADEKINNAKKIAELKEKQAKDTQLQVKVQTKQKELQNLQSKLRKLADKHKAEIAKTPSSRDQEVLKTKYNSAKNELNNQIREARVELRNLQRYYPNLIAELKEELRRYKHVTKKEAKERAIKIMQEVGIPQPEQRFKQYPFQFSGGMRQRIVIAIALTANPDVLICDEPTTALDVTIQAQILELINDLKKLRNLSVIFITHDLGVVANMANRIAVMYAGKIVEIGTAEDVFYNPMHPYTWALLSSMPDIMSKERLRAIPGTPPNMLFPPKGDAFAERNQYAMKIDFEIEPPMFKISDTHYAATWLLHPNAPKVEMPEVVKHRIERMLEHDKEVNKNG